MTNPVLNKEVRENFISLTRKMSFLYNVSYIVDIVRQCFSQSAMIRVLNKQKDSFTGENVEIS